MTLRVLIVEDDYPTRLLLRSIVEASGWDVMCAESFEEAVFHASWADIALVDCHLPGRSGIELLAELRAMNPVIGLVMVTGDESAEILAMATGADAFLLKPFELPDLHAAIEVSRRRRDAAQPNATVIALDDARPKVESPWYATC